MLLIVIVALCATTAFYRKAQAAGLHPGKAASVPFFTAGVILALAYVASLGIAKIALVADVSPFTARAVSLMLNAFLLLAYLAIIGRNWNALLQASAASGADDTTGGTDTAREFD